MVSGSLNWDLDWVIKDALRKEWNRGPMMLIHGTARGADSIAESFALDNRWSCLRYPPNYVEFGKVATHMRNQEMVDQRPDVALFFIRNFSNGTMTTLEKAVKARLKVRCFYYDDYVF
jgi:hypothetical protein